MATPTTASIIALAQPKRPLTGAERQAAYRARKAAQTKPVQSGQIRTKAVQVTRDIAVTPPGQGKPADEKQVSCATLAVTPRVTQTQVTRWLLLATAAGLGAVGMAVNGAFARSLGSTADAGWLFLAIGVAADSIAMLTPSAAAAAWAARQRGAAAAAWILWAVAFAFVVNAGIGFASLNVADVTLSRAGRVTPQVEAARNAVTDAMAARDRECQAGVGKNCRVREEAVLAARKTLEVAMQTVASVADPQSESAARIVAWLSFGLCKPSGDDFAMMRLILLALLPQLGGLLLMVGRAIR